MFFKHIYFLNLFIVICLILLMNCCRSDSNLSNKGVYPEEVGKYQFLRYSGGQEIISPEVVVKADNNWQILLECMRGTTYKKLEEKGVNFTDSQLMLLKAMRFLNYKEDLNNNSKIKTTLSILGKKQKQMLIEEVRELTEKLEPKLSKNIKKLKQILMNRGHKDHIFSIFFSGVIDGVVWFPFRAQGYVSEFSLTKERPLFDGIYWAYYPKRDFRCGSNIAMGENIFVILNWSDGPMEKIQRVFNWENLHSIHKQLVQVGRIIKEETKEKLRPYGVVDNKGELTVPVIEMKMNDPVFPVLQSIAAKIVNFMGKNLDHNTLQSKYRFPDRETAFVVFYHEFMWEFMEYLDGKGIIKKPFAFKNPKKAEPEDIGKLFFVVKGAMPGYNVN